MTIKRTPYSTVKGFENIYFISGQLPIGDSGVIESEGFLDQAKQSLKNLKRVLVNENVSIDHLLKVTIFLADIDNYQAFNEVYIEALSECETMPARSAFQVAALPMNAKIEVEAIFRK